MDHLPIFLRLHDRRVVVVGGGAVAARKAELLLQCSARVTLVAPELTAACVALLGGAPRGRIEHLGVAFDAAHLEGASLVIAATDSAAVNAAVADAAGARNIPVNVVDDLERSTFILPAIIDRSPVIVAVGSQGTAPVLARRLREQLEALLPARLGALARFAGRRRRTVQQTLRAGVRRLFWERVFGGEVATQVLAGNETAADTAFDSELAQFRARGSERVGEVYLIGAGPGDPDLLTLRALQLLQQADVVLYDRLVGEQVLRRARREAERVFVGKQPGGCRASQEQINELLVSYARRGLRVARLKGGDPFVFGRGGEELRVLTQQGIPVTVVPGITAGLGAAAAAGIALTQRDLSQSVTFATGHFTGDDTLDWHALSRPHQTVVFYMGVSELANIVARLIAAGAPRTRPVALIERATLPEQRVLRGSLADVVALAREAGVRAPALLIIGEVAAVASGAELRTVGAALQGVA
jgi:uroporphyrin-III C-methyltransferase/precorrin-2 dehydrogenase/sirohydrochlorin ferrochelatase